MDTYQIKSYEVDDIQHFWFIKGAILYRPSWYILLYVHNRIVFSCKISWTQVVGILMKDFQKYFKERQKQVTKDHW